jgi:hypothetical protein
MYGVFTKGVDMLQKNFRSDVANPATIRRYKVYVEFMVNFSFEI